MYSYQRNTARKQRESFVPKRTSTLQLVDNRPESIAQRKRQEATTTSGVIQLVKKQNKQPKNTSKKVAKKITKKKKDPFERPSFTTDSKKSAILFHNMMRKHDFEIDLNKPALPGRNAAQPHRLPWGDIRDIIRRYHNGGNSKEVMRLVRFFNRSGRRRIRRIRRRLERSKKHKHTTKIKARKELLKRAENSQKDFQTSFDNYQNNQNEKNLKSFLKQSNSHHANVPDYGPHQGVNNPVSDTIHLNLRESRSRKRVHKKDPIPRSPSPASREILEGLKPSMTKKGIAVNSNGEIITTSGDHVPISALSPELQKRVAKFKKNIIKGYQQNAPFGSPYIKGTDYS
ncbi:MAG: hypothetical protein AAF611_17305 [Bacteroidota bacterium]